MAITGKITPLDLKVMIEMITTANVNGKDSINKAIATAKDRGLYDADAPDLSLRFSIRHVDHRPSKVVDDFLLLREAKEHAFKIPFDKAMSGQTIVETLNENYRAIMPTLVLGLTAEVV